MIRTFVDALKRDIPGTCPDVDKVLGTPSVQVAWESNILDPTLRWWFIDTFVNDEERLRIHRMAGSIRKTFIDFAALNKTLTGESNPLPELLIQLLTFNMLKAGHPKAREIVFGATQYPAIRASENLKRSMPEDESWLVK
jgi:hypothetical protein